MPTSWYHFYSITQLRKHFQMFNLLFISSFLLFFLYFFPPLIFFIPFLLLLAIHIFPNHPPPHLSLLSFLLFLMLFIPLAFFTMSYFTLLRSILRNRWSNYNTIIYKYPFIFLTVKQRGSFFFICSDPLPSTYQIYFLSAISTTGILSLYISSSNI